MPTRAAARTGAARRSLKGRMITAEPEPVRLGSAAEQRDIEDWVEAEADLDRLDESEMEMLLTGHAASHGSEGEDNWLLETEEINWNER